MHTCISSHGLKRSWRSCPRRVNAGNKNTPSTHHPRRRNVTTLMVGLKTVTHAKISPKNGEPQRYSWGTQKKKKKTPGGLSILWCLTSISRDGFVCLLFVGCLTSQQHASVSQGRICTDNFTCCHTEIEAADQTFHLTQSQYTDTGPTSPSADPITPGAWQGSHWSVNV